MSVNSYKLGFASSRLRRTTVHLLFVLTLLLIIALSYSLWRAKTTSGRSLEAPALNGAAAIEYLKGQGLYPALAAAVREARRGESANDDPSCGFVGRQWFMLRMAPVSIASARRWRSMVTPSLSAFRTTLSDRWNARVQLMSLCVMGKVE